MPAPVPDRPPPEDDVKPEVVDAVIEARVVPVVAEFAPDTGVALASTVKDAGSGNHNDNMKLPR